MQTGGGGFGRRGGTGIECSWAGGSQQGHGGEQPGRQIAQCHSGFPSSIEALARSVPPRRPRFRALCPLAKICCIVGKISNLSRNKTKRAQLKTCPAESISSNRGGEDQCRVHSIAPQVVRGRV